MFATLDAGAPKTVGIYFMYDVKQADPSEWTSPPFEARLVDKPGLGKVLIGRGAVNQRGPEAMWLAALHAFKGAGRKLPVNLVFVAEGEEEIGSPHFPQIVQRPEMLAAFRKCTGVYMPMPMQALDGTVTINLGAEGRDRTGTGVERRAVASRTEAGPALVERSSRGQSRRGTWCRRWRRWWVRTATRRRSTATPKRRGR